MAVSSSSTSNPTAQKLADLKAELVTASARYAPEHPRIVSLQAQIASLEANMGSERSVVSGVTTSISPEYQSLQGSLANARVDQESAAKRVKTYEQIAKDAEDRVNTLTALQGKARTLKADIDLLERHIGELETQLTPARDAARTPPLDWRVLTPAAEPEWPERSKRRVIAAAMPIAGALMALLVLLIRPTVDGRVYTAREAAFWGNLAVVGSSAWPRDREMFFTLVDELGDHGAAARGCTLILGASEREQALAEELAYWLGGKSAGLRKVGAMATTRLEMPTTVATSGNPSEPARDGSSRRPGPASQSAPVARTEALVRMPQPASLGMFGLEGAQAWVGASEGPSLRRAARMADRVLVLLGSGGELFSSVAGLRTRLGRDHGVGIVLLGVGAELLRLPDRAGNVEAFWRATASGR